MRKRLAKKVYRGRHTGRYPRHMIKKALIRLFPPGWLRIWMPITPIIESQSLIDIEEIDDTEFLKELDRVCNS